MKRINGIEIEVLRGDITKVTTDGLIVPQASDHVLKNKLNKRLSFCGAEEGFEIYKAYVSLNCLPIGKVLLTDGGGNAKHLLHTIVNPSAEAYTDLQTCLHQALMQAQQNKISTLALPELRNDTGDLLFVPENLIQTVLSVLAVFSNDEGIVKEFTVILDCGLKEYEKAVEVLENFSEPAQLAV